MKITLHNFAAALIGTVVATGSLNPLPASAQEASPDVKEVQILGYLEPIRDIHLTTSEAGRISEIFLKQGDPVTKGQPILKLDTKAHESGLEIAKLQANSNASIDAATAEKDLTQIKLDALMRVSRNARSTAETLRAKANVQIAEAKLQSANEEKAMAAHQVSKIEAEIERRFIRSPIDGVVNDIKKDKGEFLSPSEESVVHVTQLDKLRLVVHVPAKYARALAKDMVLPVIIGEERIAAVGTIEFLSLVIDPSSGTVRTRLIVENPELKIRSGAQAFVTVARSS